MHPEDQQLRQALLSRDDVIADRWHRALATTGFVALSTGLVHQRLVKLVDRAIDLFVAGAFDHSKAEALGVDLARLYYAHPEALSRTLNFLALELLEGLPPDQRLELIPRLMALTSELAAGFLGQSRQTLLTEQESIRAALLSARQQTQDALRASEARFRAVFDAAAIGMGVGDVDGNIREVNHAFQAMMGYSADEMRRMNVGQLTHPDDMVSVWQLYQALVEGKHDYFQAEKRYYRKDGETIWCHLTVSLIRDVEGSPQYQIAMMENITERKQAEEARLRSEAASALWSRMHRTSSPSSTLTARYVTTARPSWWGLGMTLMNSLGTASSIWFIRTTSCRSGATSKMSSVGQEQRFRSSFGSVTRMDRGAGWP